MRELRSRHPRFREAVVADAVITARFRGERAEFGSTLDTVLQVVRLMLQADAFLAQVAYRAKARMQALGVPLLPRIAHRIAMMSAQVKRYANRPINRPGAARSRRPLGSTNR